MSESDEDIIAKYPYYGSGSIPYPSKEAYLAAQGIVTPEPEAPSVESKYPYYGSGSIPYPSKEAYLAAQEETTVQEEPVITTPVEEDKFVPVKEASLPEYTPPPEEEVGIGVSLDQVPIVLGPLVEDEPPAEIVAKIEEEYTPTPEEVWEAPSDVGVATPIEEGITLLTETETDPEPLDLPQSSVKVVSYDDPSIADKLAAYKEYGEYRTGAKLAEEKAAVEITELVSLQESIDSGISSNLPDPLTFTGIPGPASGPRPGSVGAKIQEGVDEALETMENTIVGLVGGLSGAGKELGAGAQEAWEEGDLVEAALRGTAAFSARAGAGLVEGASFIFRPLAWGKTAEALILAGKGAVEHPEDVPGGVQTWAKNVMMDPGSIVEFAGDIAGGFAVTEVVKAIVGPTHVLSRVDDLDVNVKSSALELVDDVDPFTGKSVKVPQFPEAELTPTVSKKTISKAATEIMESELDELSGVGKVLGVADEGDFTVLQKIDVPEGALDDLLEGKKVTIKDHVKIEKVIMGGDDLAIKAKELSDSYMVDTPVDDALRKVYKKLGIEEVASEVGGDSIEFGGPWHKAGVEDVLEKGQRRYTVKGVLMEGTPDIIDDIPEFIPLEPGTGPKTPLSKTFGIVDDVIPLLDDPIVKQITEKTVALSKIVTEPASVPASVTVGLGLGATLVNDLLGEEKAVKQPAKVDGLDVGLWTGRLGIPILDEGTDTKPRVGPFLPGFPPRPEPVKVIPVIIPDVVPVIPKPVPLVIPDIIPPKPKPVPPIVDPIQIPDDIQEIIPYIVPDVVEDTIVPPVQIEELKQKAALPPPIFHLGTRKSRPPFDLQRKPRIKRLRRGKNALVGFELKTTELPSPEDILGKKRKKRFRLPKL